MKSAKTAPKSRTIKAKAASAKHAGPKSLPLAKRVPPTAPPSRGAKIGQVIALLRQPGGATLQVLIDATGWQAHSVRGAISGTLKKKLALTIESERVEGERIYRIVG